MKHQICISVEQTQWEKLQIASKRCGYKQTVILRAALHDYLQRVPTYELVRSTILAIGVGEAAYKRFRAKNPIPGEPIEPKPVGTPEVLAFFPASGEGEKTLAEICAGAITALGVEKGAMMKWREDFVYAGLITQAGKGYRRTLAGDDAVTRASAQEVAT